MKLQRNEQGFSLIELLIVVAIIGIIATIAVPQLMNALDRGRQKRTMADMRNIASANGTYRVDWNTYVTVGSGSLEPDYMQTVPAEDGWGNGWVGDTAAVDTHCLESGGADGVSGAATLPWLDSDQEYDPSLTLQDGQFLQAPGIDSTGTC